MVQSTRILWCFRYRISSFSLVQMLLKACHEILVLEVIGDSCSQQRVGTVRQRVGTVGKGLVVFITSSNCRWKSLSGKEYKQCTQQNMGRDIQLLCHNLIGCFIPA